MAEYPLSIFRIMWRRDVDELWRSLNILHGKCLKEGKAGGMKTRVNGKPFINSRACNADLGDQVRRRTGNTTICVKVFRKAGRAW